LGKRALITGVTGQDGSYLAELLLDKGYEVHGIKRRTSQINTRRIDHLMDHEHFHLFYGDVTDPINMMQIIGKHLYDEIYNLAAMSHVAVSFETPYYTANADGTAILGILEAVRLLGLDTKIYQAGTSEMFGNAKAPQSEATPFEPCSPYACAKVMAHHLMATYRRAYDMHCVNGILFNHESPRRGETFVTQKIIQGAKRLVKGEGGPILLGNVKAVRDWGHARDYVRGMWLMMQHEIPQDWVLATGLNMSVEQFATYVFKELGFDLIWQGEGLDRTAYNPLLGTVIECRERYYRPTEVNHLQGDASKAYNLLGWMPYFDVHLLIHEMLNAKNE